jgi:hypothetical protein
MPSKMLKDGFVLQKRNKKQNVKEWKHKVLQTNNSTGLTSKQLQYETTKGKRIGSVR